MNRIILRTESLAILTVSVVAYSLLDYSWPLFAILLLAPDLAMFGYLQSNKMGARIYNLFHTYTKPIVVIATGYAVSESILISIGLIWIAHIAMDRTLGFGLKYESGFKETHLQRL